MTEQNRDGFNACVIGASGGIGAAFVQQLLQRANCRSLLALARRSFSHDDPRVSVGHIDVVDETSVAQAAMRVSAPLDLVLVATGLLHDADAGLRPEKTWRTLEAAHMTRVLQVNTVGPALVARHFLPHLRPASRSVFAALSARVGSIGDNRLGGWYSYRASKAALNMLLRTLAIEVARSHREAVVVGLHPGTVDSALSRPFQGNVPPGKLFDPEVSAAKMLEVLDGLDASHSGHIWDYAGTRVPA